MVVYSSESSWRRNKPNLPFSDAFGHCRANTIVANHGVNANRLPVHADLALYAGKESGCQTRRKFYHSLGLPRSLDVALHHAFDRSQFELHYQPLIDIAGDYVDGLEALIRWKHPIHGLIPPNVFIPTAEQSLLIVPLTEWVILEATTQLKRWAISKPDSFKIAVNVSPILLKSQNFVDFVDKCFHATGCDPQNLTIEITENVMIDEDKAIPVLTALRARGVTIAIDDFGVGYSSLARLKNLPVDILKIDRTLLNGVINDPIDATIVETLVKVGHRLGKKVVAEGVEDYEQLEYLERVGCDFAQGFLISRPVQAADIPAWLENRKPSATSGFD